MQFTVHCKEDQFLVIGGSENNTLRVGDLSDLLRLRQRINAYVDNQIDDGDTMIYSPNRRITVSSAVEIAAAQGITLKSNTVFTAARRGRIADAAKEGSHWTFPLNAFQEWLARNQRRSATKTPAAECSPSPDS